MSWETLDWSVDGDGVATLVLDRPDALNAFDLTMAGELEQLFRDAARDDSVRAIVVTGAGRAFCAGMDLAAEGNVFGLDESLRPTPRGVRRAVRRARPTRTACGTPAARSRWRSTTAPSR